MKITLENDEFATHSDSLNQEEGRSEGSASWDNEELPDNAEEFDTEGNDDTEETLVDSEPDYPEEYNDPQDQEEIESDDTDDDSNDEDSDDEDSDDNEDTEQKNTPIENPSRVLKYSEYFSSI
jgi:hypothetical protein